MASYLEAKRRDGGQASFEHLRKAGTILDPLPVVVKIWIEKEQGIQKRQQTESKDEPTLCSPCLSNRAATSNLLLHVASNLSLLHITFQRKRTVLVLFRTTIQYLYETVLKGPV